MVVVALLAAQWGLCLAADPAKAPQAPWWDSAWKYRQTVTLYTPPLASGINTAVAEIDPLGKALPDGRDVRVVTPQKTLLPLQVERGEGGVLKVLFQVPPGNAETFFIYYGNPSAPAAQGQWEKHLGGLTMETRALIQQRYSATRDQLQEVLSAGTQVYGRGPRPCINDNRNPFSPQQEHYTAIYKGKIFCPESGRYSFATNSDDASFLLIDGNMVCEWPGAHDAEIGWTHTGEVELPRGVHSIDYYMVQFVGAALARAAWKKPGEKEYAVIPPPAFVQTLLTRVTAFQEYQKSISAFFAQEMGRQIRFNKLDRVFTRVAFRDCSTTQSKSLKSWR